MDLKNSLVSTDVNHTDNDVLPSQDFSRITRLKVFGDSSPSPIADDDLITISGTATSLGNLHYRFHLDHHQRPCSISLGITHIPKALGVRALLRLGLHTPFLRRISLTNPHFCTLVFMSSVLNSPGPPQGPTGGLPRALDRTGRQNAVHTRPRNLRMAFIVEDSKPCKVRHFSRVCRRQQGTTGDYGGLWETVGDCGGL